MTLYSSEGMTFEPSQDFKDCHAVVKEHLLLKSDSGLVWQKSSPSPPFAEHLSFHLGNQKFFVRINDIDDELEVPPNTQGTKYAAKLFNGIECDIWVKKIDGNWTIMGDDWALHAPEDGEYPVQGWFDPTDLLTEEKIPLNSAEIHYSAVICLRDEYLSRFKLPYFYAQYDPGLLPSFRMQRDGVSYVESFIVLASHYPDWNNKLDQRRKTIDETIARLMDEGEKTYIVDAQLISAEQDLKDSENIIPVCRCEPYYVAASKIKDWE